MASIKFPAFAPDQASVDASVCSVATNVVPRADGYGPFMKSVPLSPPLPENCRGAVKLISPGFGYPIYFAGTATKLYKFNPGSATWVDVTKPGASYGIPPDDYWSFALYGSRLVATTLGTVMQVIDVDQGTAFADLAGNPPRARYISIVSEFLVAAGLASDPNAVAWSDLGDIEYWQFGVKTGGHTSDIQIFPEGGTVTGFAGGEFGLVWQESKIRRMVFSPGSAQVFDFSVLEENRGSVAPWSLVKVGARVFFLDREGFFSFSGGASTPIGAERVNRFFTSRVDPNRITATIAIRDVTGPRVMFAYRTAGVGSADATVLDEILLYDWILDRWTYVEQPVRFGLDAATTALSLDDITTPVDEPNQKSYDDPSYSGGVPSLGFITADNRLSLANGSPLEALIETPDAMLSRPNRAYVRGLRLDGDADDWRAQVGTRETLKVSDPVRYRDETAPNYERFAPCHASGRYHRARIRIPEGVTWSYASGVEPDVVTEGMR